ncbi:hypothetical protein ABT297_04355 [Dactylosporangium sp. NPDC000555]|uniref:hypothetical protein n=1 Tax=Dactylosporangium sp. NPDC000555 TaxID=3154260 RepID=UPI00332D6738
MRSTKLLQLLFWGGVGLSPLAALLLLVGSGFVLQVAAVLAVLVVVLIGLSIALRPGGDTVRGEVEELVYEEIDTLREDIRGDITHAARATHGQLMERIGVLHETVDALRNQVDMMRGQLDRAAAQAPHPPHPVGSASVPQGVLRRTETVQVTTKTMVVDPADSRSGTVYGGPPAPRAEIPQQRRPDRSERVSERPSGRPDPRQDRPDQRADPRLEHREEPRPHPDRGFDRPERAGRSERSERGERIERDPRRDERGRDERGREDSREQPWPEESREPSWTGHQVHERHERMARADSGDWPQTQPSGEVERRGGGRRRAPDSDDEGSVTGVRTTDRWASVHSDERGGRELRMGERRAAVHADETGTHVRIEDRWASVRHEEYYPEERSTGGHRAAIEDDRDDDGHDSRYDARYDSGTESPRRSEARRERERDWATHEPERDGRRRAEARWSDSTYEEGRRDESGTTRWSEARRDRPALGSSPAALSASPAEPASRWTSGVGGPSEAGRDEERVSRRARADDDEYGWNGVRDEHRGRAARQIVDFEGNDDRWQ